MPIAMPSPTTEDFKRIEKLMWEKWNIPNCVSSIDGKHVRIKAPPHSGSLFLSIKTIFLIFLFFNHVVNFSVPALCTIINSLLLAEMC